MFNLQDLIQQSYEALLYHAAGARIILLHSHSRYRSMVIARLLAAPPRPVYYYSMGPHDVNLEAFLAGFVHDMCEQKPTFGRHLSTLAHPLFNVDREEIIDRLLHDLEELSTEAFFLVLDEYDASENADDIQEFLEAVLTRLPANCQVIINSRTLPRLPWVAMVAQHDAVIVSDKQVIEHDPYRITSRGDLAELTVRCLGPGNIVKNGTLIDDWEGHLPRLLFIFALERPVVTRAEICQSFWPNLDNDQAVNVFHVTKRRLHKALGFDALIHQNGYYQVNPDVRIFYDVMEFVSALVRGRTAKGPEAAEAWQTAIDLYQGPFLQGHNEIWVERQRTAYQTGYLEAMMAVANLRLQSGRPEHALRILMQASSGNEDFEPLHQEIMKLYTSLGRRSEAASYYQTLVEALKGKGKTPNLATQTLYQQLMA
jgi:DNA-binding SARP family transcriptional activator